MSNSKAARRKDTADVLKGIKKEKRDLNAISRRNASGTGPVSFGTVSTNMGVSVGFNPNIQIGTGLKVGGDVMMGPIAYNSQEKTLASGVLTLTDLINTVIGISGTSWTIVNGEGGSADDLVTINGAVFSGQILYLQAKNQAITLKTTGNIHTNDNADVVLSAFNSGAGTGGEVATLIYDDKVTGGNWVVVNVGSGGAGSGANTTLSNLTSPTAINQDLNMQGNSLVLDADKDTYIESTTDDTLIMQVGGSSAITINNTNILTAKPISVLIGSVNMNTNPINFQNTGQSISSTTGGIIHSVPTSDTHGFAVNGDLKLSISGSSTTLTDNLVMNTNDITSIQNLQFSSNLSTPSTNGTIYAQDISGVRRVFVRTGNTTKDLTDIGTGGSGGGANTSLSNLSNTSVNTTLNMNHNKIQGINNIFFNTTSTSVNKNYINSNNDGMQFSLDDNSDQFSFYTDANDLKCVIEEDYIQLNVDTIYGKLDGTSAIGSTNHLIGYYNGERGYFTNFVLIDGSDNSGNVLLQVTGDTSLGSSDTHAINFRGTVKVGSSSSSKVGFFGTSPVVKQTLASFPSTTQIRTLLAAYGLC